VLQGFKELKVLPKVHQDLEVLRVLQGFKAPKVPSKDTREPVVMEVQQVSSVLRERYKGHQDLLGLKEQQVIMEQQV
jgi:hypothetical protein